MHIKTCIQLKENKISVLLNYK